MDPLFDVGPVTFPAYEATSTGLRALGATDEARAAYESWRRAAHAAMKRAEGALAARLAGYRARAVQVAR